MTLAGMIVDVKRGSAIRQQLQAGVVGEVVHGHLVYGGNPIDRLLSKLVAACGFSSMRSSLLL